MHSSDAYETKRGADGERLEQAIEKDRESGGHTHVVETPFNLSAYVAYLLGGFSPVIRKSRKLVNEIRRDVVHNHEIPLFGYHILKKLDEHLNLYDAHDFWLICQNQTLFKNRRGICKNKQCLPSELDWKCPPQFWRYVDDARLRLIFLNDSGKRR